MQFKCKECGEEFDKDRSLHAHLKKHKISIADYYHKYFPRYDLYTGKLIKFKDVKRYLTTDFNSPSNLIKWCELEDKEKVKEYLLKRIGEKLDEKEFSRVFGHIQLKSYNFPGVDFVKNLFGSYSEFSNLLERKPQFYKNITKEFYEDYSDLEILIDTREQNPLSFKNQRFQKLDCGDYGLTGNNYSYTFIDRKSTADFISTMSTGLDRFKNEVKRCSIMGCYLFVLVESTMEGVEKKMLFSRNIKTNINHVWHNMREIMYEFPEHCQFVFSGSRANSEILVPKLLKCGRQLWDTDIQYFIERDDLWLGK